MFADRPALWTDHLFEPFLEWINDNLSPDFHMCCYYDPTPRTSSPHPVVSNAEVFDPCPRDEMTRFIGKLKAPAVHYKVLAAGRTPAKDAARTNAELQAVRCRKSSSS